jgi:hypothetical protein
MQLEAQLSTHAAEKRMRSARVLSIAASLLIIVSVGFLGLYIVNTQMGYTSEIYSQRLEPLTTEPIKGTTIYDTEKVKDLTSTWKD